jgi:hypothetical protein
MTWKAPSLAEILNDERSIAEIWNGERRPYTGVLAEPIPDTEDVGSLLFDLRLPALCEHYSIDVGDPHVWMRLCVELARAHVPGWQVTETKERGRPPMDLDTLVRVERDVETLKAEGCRQQEAFERLARRYGLSPAGVRSRYEALKKRREEIRDQIRDWLARERQRRETEAAAIQPRTAEELRHERQRLKAETQRLKAATQRVKAMTAAARRDLRVIKKVVERQRNMRRQKEAC